MQEEPAREKAQLWPLGAQTRSLGLSWLGQVGRFGASVM